MKNISNPRMTRPLRIAGTMALAAKLGISRGTLYRVTRGIRPCSAQLRARIEAEGFTVPPLRSRARRRRAGEDM